MEVTDLATGRIGIDHVVVEEPLDIRVAGPHGPGTTLAVTMRTPGDDLALAVGLCWAEGLLRGPEDLLDASWCPDTTGGRDRPQGVLVRLRLTPDLDGHARHGIMTSACGVCGRTTVDDLAAKVNALGIDPSPRPAAIGAAMLHDLPGRLRAAQAVFGATGGLHAVARFAHDGTLLDHAEDVGRHNAFDKVVGRAVRATDVPWGDEVVLLSGRASYELLAKAAMVGVPVVAAIGAPSSLAIEVADRAGICLIGFLRDGRGNIHTHPDRIGLDRYASTLAARP